VRRNIPALCACVLAALAACYAAWGQSPRRDGPAPGPASAPGDCPRPAPAAERCRPARAARLGDEGLVEGLVAILEQTDSPDTLLVTVKALADLGPRARGAVPAIIRGADRLGLLKGLAHQKGDGEGLAVVRAIEEILKGNGAGPTAPCCYSVVTPATPPAGVPVPSLNVPPAAP
jgi:hypothetical protein